MRQYAWAILVVAGAFETGFSIGLEHSQGFTRLWPSIATAIMIVLSLGLGDSNSEFWGCSFWANSRHSSARKLEIAY